MRLKAIICEVLAREIYFCAARTPHVVDVELVAKGLHDTPTVLRAELQNRISAATADRYDAVVLAYGLCGNSITDLKAGQVPLIIPRAHDCITLYLGSRDRYQTYFTAHPGTYYYTADYIERGGSNSLVPLGTGVSADMRSVYDEYVAKYGQENADYLMEVMGAWTKYYSRATYIDIEGPELPDYRDAIKAEASRRGWTYEEVRGQLSLLWDLMAGNWDDDRFLKLAPGEGVTATYDDRIIGIVQGGVSDG